MVCRFGGESAKSRRRIFSAGSLPATLVSRFNIVAWSSLSRESADAEAIKSNYRKYDVNRFHKDKV